MGQCSLICERHPDVKAPIVMMENNSMIDDAFIEENIVNQSKDDLLEIEYVGNVDIRSPPKESLCKKDMRGQSSSLQGKTFTEEQPLDELQDNTRQQSTLPVSIETEESKYEGQTKQGAREGFGRMFYIDGAYYEGFWKNNLYHGYGKLIKSTDETFEGHWINGIMSGKGRYTYDDGKVYEGDWLNNLPHGEGVELFTDGQFYIGEFANGLKSGIGSIRNPDGSHYTGEFLDDLYHGFGKYTWKDGRYYEGEWECGLMHGQGKTVCVDGQIYCGGYLYGKKSGFGEYFTKQGFGFYCLWKDGKPEVQTEKSTDEFEEFNKLFPQYASCQSQLLNDVIVFEGSAESSSNQSDRS